jgi:hypothetical protein
MDFINFW